MILNRKKIEIARAQKLLTISALAKAARCTPNCLTGKEPYIDVPVMTAGRIAHALEVRVDSLIDDCQEFEADGETN